MKLLKPCCLGLILFLCVACNSNSSLTFANGNQKTILNGQTMGTRYNIAIIHPTEVLIDKKIIQKSIDGLLKDLNQQVSTYVEDSKISQFNKLEDTNWQTVDTDFFSIIESAQDISKKSHGAYDVTLSPLIDLWGFGVKNHDKSPDSAQIKSAMSFIGYEKLKFDRKNFSLKKTHPKLRIDLSGIAKGYAVDIISHFLNQQNFNNHLVEIGGELKVSGLNQDNKKWRIAIEQPDLSVDIAQNGIEITNLALATSGDYRNYYIDKGVRRSHIIDPKTGYPITHKLASVTVLHESTMMADAYATAILVLGETAGQEFVKENNLEVFMVIRDGEHYKFWNSSSLIN